MQFLDGPERLSISAGVNTRRVRLKSFAVFCGKRDLLHSVYVAPMTSYSAKVAYWITCHKWRFSKSYKPWVSIVHINLHTVQTVDGEKRENGW